MIVTVVVGGQAGSEGKGAVCGRLHRESKYRFAVRVGGPNAGHSVVDDNGKKWALRQLPVAAVADPDAQLVIAAGSEIDPEVLRDEIQGLEAGGFAVKDRLLIDQEATLVEPAHSELEEGIKTGTTGKGIGAARAHRAVRLAKRAVDTLDLNVVNTQGVLWEALERRDRILVEGTQGYILGSHAGYYPYCTSGDCRAIDMLAMAGLPPMDVETWVVLRTYPIRIAGESGDLPGETSWDELGLNPEITTVTKKVRRVGEWNWAWARESVDANSRPDARAKVALTFADYWWPDVAGHDGWRRREALPPEIRSKLYEIDLKLNTDIAMLGTGSSTQILLRKEGDAA